jgi:hypothetical protein
LLALFVLVASSLWAWRGSSIDPRVWLAVLAGALLWLAWALRLWWNMPTGQLRWDAQAPGVQGLEVGAWFWIGGVSTVPQPVAGLAPSLDLQRLILLRLRAAPGAPRWVWVQRSSDPARWLDLRRALQRATA